MLDFNDSEQFRELKDFPGYGVGVDGTVWSRWKRGKGEILLGSHWKQLKGGVNRYGYRHLLLYRNGERRSFTFHALVLLAFVGPRPAPRMVCRHLDGNRQNNNLSNLRWGTELENAADRIQHGNAPCGEKHYRAKLTADQVRKIRALHDGSYGCGARLSRQFGITHRMVKLIVERVSWKHVN